MNNLKTGARQSLIVNDRSKPEQPNFSSAVLPNEFTENVKDISTRRSANFVKHFRKAKEEEELVKHMSNLPSYLERGDTHHEKVLNFGVLDWGRLEKYRNSRHSVSSANPSSTFSTEGSSNMGLRNNVDGGTSQGENSEAVRYMRATKNGRDSGNIRSLNKLQEQKAHAIGQGLSQKYERVSDAKPITINPNAKEPSIGVDLKLSKRGVEKPRSTSPFRRLAIGVGKIGKTFSSKEGLAVPQLSTNHNSAKFPSENAKASSSRGPPSSDIQSATSRARSSPLRRLLDPLLKPKAVYCRHYGEPLDDRVSKSSNRRLDSSNGARQPTLKFDVAINFENPSREKKPGLSSFRALLRVAVKNGQPLFTFAVDNESDILAATSKKLSSSRDDGYRCIYTFFAIQEAKKKNGRWINQGGKDKSNDCIPNIVAQLKVSGSRISREKYEAQSFAREFVLFSVGLGKEDQQALPNDELAAIVVEIPKAVYRSTAMGRHWTRKCDGDLKFGYCSAEEPNISSINAAVILPSGVHTLPNKGGPSSLIQRWRSGGSCDCGGWDLGCKLGIFSNQNRLVMESSTSVAWAVKHKFELISQGGEEENQSVFSLAPFKDGIYSVEFTSALSILQAFSLCIAVVDSKKLCEIPERSKFEEKTSLEAILAGNDSTKGSEADTSARFVSYPPHSRCN